MSILSDDDGDSKIDTYTARSDLYSFNLAALITVSGKNYGFYGVLGFTAKFGGVLRCAGQPFAYIDISQHMIV